jgi:hypothetical protein
MTNWEYGELLWKGSSLSFLGPHDVVEEMPGGHIVALTRLGSAGWEAYAVHNNPEADERRYHLKRQLT